MSLPVRRAAPAGAPAILRHIRALAACERQPDAAQATEASLGERRIGGRPATGRHPWRLEGEALDRLADG